MAMTAIAPSRAAVAARPAPRAARRASARAAATTTDAALTTTKSDEIMSEAMGIMPGGVSSPVRAFKSVGGGPIVFDKVKGANRCASAQRKGFWLRGGSTRAPPAHTRRPFIAGAPPTHIKLLQALRYPLSRRVPSRPLRSRDGAAPQLPTSHPPSLHQLPSSF